MALLTRWAPFTSLRDQMANFQREMDQLFASWGMGTRGRPILAPAYPPVNVWEDEDFVYAEAELPGMKQAEVEVAVTSDNQLTLKGTRPPLQVDKAEWHRRERAVGPFERAIALPIAVDPAKVEARLENGVLTVKMAKAPQAKPRKIPVKSV